MDLTVFEKKYLESFKQLSELKKEQNRLAKIEADVKAETRVAASESKSIDLKALETKEHDLYEELLADYPKVTTKKAYIRIVVK